MKFTKEQQLAIDIRNKNILVSAAAGSGKTAVLVKRIIDRVLDEKNPIDIDRILVMTFTNAAAAQMKERILDAIEEKRKEKPFDKNLQKQAALIHSANISTIDSFCLNVVRNHFSEIDMNPDFRIADQGELKLMKQDVLEEVMEKCYEAGDESFLFMTESFSTGKNDSQIEKIILMMNDFSESYPEPEEWLTNCGNEYLCSKESLENANWLKEYFDGIISLLNSQRMILDRACDICSQEFGPEAYLTSLEADMEFIDELAALPSYSMLSDHINEMGKPSFTKLKSVKMPKAGEAPESEISLRNDLKKQVGDVRDKYKKFINQLFDDVLNNPLDIIQADMQSMYPSVNALIRLTIEFQRAFNKKKREKNVVDFNDLEHLCLRILSESPSASEEYRKCFCEIYVDEYQDSNLVQEEIVKHLCLKSETEGNLFMVGDVKQSIYGFRLARPEIFVEKYNRFPEYSQDSRENVKIDLHDNFRSRTCVIESANDMFSHLMTEETGKIIYDDKAALHAKADYPEGEGFKTEFLYAYHTDEINNRQLEARIVAKRIKEMIETLSVSDGEKLVPLKYSDIVILLRSAKDWDTVFQSVLEEEGIPVHVESSTGYFSRQEVAILLEYLKIIDNPHQDIPLMAVLRSCIGRMYDEEIAIIRGAFPDGDLYSSIIYYNSSLQEGLDEKAKGIKQKLTSFLNELNYYRNKTDYTSVDLIISEIIDGYYGDCVLAGRNGRKNYANLQILLEKAREYGKTSYKGIFHFNRYIETLHKYEVDFGEASILDEKDDAVRIMTIHKSKGLEFPVCFISGMAKKMNAMDERGMVVADPDWGIGVDVVDPLKRTRKKTLYKKALIRKKHMDSLSEELRVFYVAMTRAKEKLLMSAIVNKPGDLEANNVILLNASSYLDLYKYVSNNYLLESIDRLEYSVEDVMSTKIEESIETEARKEMYISTLLKDDIELPENIKDRLAFVYPFSDDKSGLKISVSELKRRSMSIVDSESEKDNDTEIKIYKEPEKIIPSFMKKEDEDVFSPALRGTAVHRVFEILDYRLDCDLSSIKTFLTQMRDIKRLEKDLYQLVNPEVIYDFLKSDIALRMKKAYETGFLFREQPFVIEDEDSKMLIQGIIDAYFIEDDKIVVVDYKTDKAKNEEYLVEKYTIQLDYYAKALAMLTGKEIKEKVIYSTYLKKSIII